ncbi:MAG TPA: hypothetical protein VEU51_08625 [Candidatus Acidoferrales bacterium]|nr:hypothetical protein [Candidatus Acidoferrales bacterium]
MKLILSRKGFDSAYGGCASPILDGDLLCPLPIPDARAATTYAEVSFNGASVGPIVRSLTRGRIASRDRAHLDPDLRRDAIARTPGWRPIFGQAGAAQSHLARHSVGPGDLFLFFGWFRRAERRGGELRYVHDAPDLHVIFGWLQVAQVYRVTDGLARELRWAKKHPHLFVPGRYANNTIYIARERLTLAGSRLPGAGVFARVTDNLILTQLTPYLGRSTWRLPRWFHPRRRAPLSRHGRADRWRLRGDSVQLRSVPIGQEFVLDLDLYPEVLAWLGEIFRDVTRGRG